VNGHGSLLYRHHHKINGGIAMLLTKKRLNTILVNLKVRIPADLEKELLDEYGNPVTDDDGHIFEYTDQDISEQLRKILRPYQGQ
jgi:hypothetical protein